MSSEQLATRIISEQTEISSSKIRRGEIRKPISRNWPPVRKHDAEVPLHVDQTGGISIASALARARRLKRQRGLDLLVVDYIQLLSGSAKSRTTACRKSRKSPPA
jgi:replicative DNA helicase